jgi:two-component system response regulator AtoC
MRTTPFRRLAWLAIPPLAMADLYAPRVLVIEDDPNLREIILALLASFGFVCQPVNDGPSALVHLDDGGYDLVLTDLAMSAVRGWEVVEAIRQRASTVPVVVLTKACEPAVLRRAHECHVTVVVKPFVVGTLKAALVDALYAKLA